MFFHSGINVLSHSNSIIAGPTIARKAFWPSFLHNSNMPAPCIKKSKTGRDYIITHETMPRRPLPFTRGKIFLLALLILLQACSASHPHANDNTGREDAYKSESLQKGQKQFAVRNPPIVSRIGNLILTVKMATPANTPEEEYIIWLYGIGEGAGSFALGLAAPPMYAGAMVLGGVLIVPLGTYLYLHEKKIWNSINNALTNAEFTNDVEKAVRARIEKMYTEESMPAVSVEIIIQTFGIIKSPADLRHCFILSAEIKIRQGDKEIHQSPLLITEKQRSEGAPPPQCASFEYFAKNDARLVKETLHEYAEVLAALSIKRISTTIDR